MTTTLSPRDQPKVTSRQSPMSRSRYIAPTHLKTVFVRAFVGSPNFPRGGINSLRLQLRLELPRCCRAPSAGDKTRRRQSSAPHQRFMTTVAVSPHKLGLTDRPLCRRKRRSVPQLLRLRGHFEPPSYLIRTVSLPHRRRHRHEGHSHAWSEFSAQAPRQHPTTWNSCPQTLAVAPPQHPPAGDMQIEPV